MNLKGTILNPGVKPSFMESNKNRLCFSTLTPSNNMASSSANKLSTPKMNIGINSVFAASKAEGNGSGLMGAKSTKVLKTSAKENNNHLETPSVGGTTVHKHHKQHTSHHIHDFNSGPTSGSKLNT